MTWVQIAPADLAGLRDMSARLPRDMARQRRLSLQYGAGTLCLAAAGVLLDSPVIGFAVWAVFALWLGLRLRASARVTAAHGALLSRISAANTAPNRAEPQEAPAGS